MSRPALCPRCDGPLRAPDLWSSEWRCERHGPVVPWHAGAHVVPEALHQVARQAGVPVWSVWPAPPGWTLAGHGHCGDDRGPHAATAVAFAGPAPLGGLAELVLVAEEPGVGLGARFAGVDAVDPGLPLGGAEEKIIVAGHDTPLWRCETPADRTAYVGEAGGVWLWAVLWPADAGYLLLEHVELVDLREEPARLAPAGAPSPRLRETGTGPAGP